MKAPIRRLTKSQIEWLADSGNRCKHRHTYLEHYQCFLNEKPVNAPFHERVGYLDIESTGLKGNWDYMLCWCIKEAGKEDILGRHLKPREITGYKFDKDLTKELIDTINKFDRVITYYGIRFDIPFIKTRAEKWGLDFPAYRDLWQTDVYFIAKANLLLHSTRLMHVCDLLGIPNKEHKLIPDIWMKAKSGHVPSLEWIFTHCQEDVTSLEMAHERLKKYTLPQKRSI
jgi:uncharacterized protein YprB with RNaseH-like and TPR domain